MITEDPGGTFLRALARRIGTRVVVFVPNARTPRSLWIGEPGDEAQIAELEATAREWLAAREIRPGGTARTRGDSDRRIDPAVAIAPARSTRNGVVGALVAAKSLGGVWTEPERALVRFAGEYYGTTLDHCARRPRPVRALLPGLPAGRGSELESRMRAAPSRGELFLHYQPEVDLTTDEVVAVEALVRWEHPERGELGPESFISLAEQTGLITVLGTWVIDESLRRFASWTSLVPDLDVTLRINVSPVQLTGQAVVRLFAAALAEHGVRGDRVCVEITENVLPSDLDELAAALRGLRELGVTSAIDDLATGYSTLSRLRSLPVDVVKLDRSLVSGIDDDWRAQAIVGALVSLAAELGVEVVAEGVENAAEAAALVRLGCTRAQGHFYARPLTDAAVLDMLRERGRRTDTAR